MIVRRLGQGGVGDAARLGQSGRIVAAGVQRIQAGQAIRHGGFRRRHQQPAQGSEEKVHRASMIIVTGDGSSRRRSR